jgi:hypothetical protein
MKVATWAATPPLAFAFKLAFAAYLGDLVTAQTESNWIRADCNSDSFDLLSKVCVDGKSGHITRMLVNHKLSVRSLKHGNKRTDCVQHNCQIAIRSKSFMHVRAVAERQLKKTCE